MGGPGKAHGFVSQETSVSRELWECSLVYKWEQRGIKVWFAFSHLSAFMAVELWASWKHLSPERPWKWREVSFPWLKMVLPACGPCAAHTSWPHTQQGRGQPAGHSLGQDAWEAVGSHLEGPWEQLCSEKHGHWHMKIEGYISYSQERWILCAVTGSPCLHHSFSIQSSPQSCPLLSLTRLWLSSFLSD